VEHEAVPLNLSDAHLLFNPTVALREAGPAPGPPDDPPF
jgi:hypothetical protein